MPVKSSPGSCQTANGIQLHRVLMWVRQVFNLCSPVPYTQSGDSSDIYLKRGLNQRDNVCKALHTELGMSQALNK